MIRFAACAAMAVARLVELAYSRRNLRRHPRHDEGRWSHQTYPLIVLTHTVVIVVTLLHGRRRPSVPWLLVLLAAQPMRLWVLLLLRDRWNTRAAIPADLRIETRGPYRLIRHPNYAVVVVELLALPMAFRLRRLAAIATATNAALLTVRIRDEERLLLQVPGYREHFGAKARFLPRLL